MRPRLPEPCLYRTEIAEFVRDRDCETEFARPKCRVTAQSKITKRLVGMPSTARKELCCTTMIVTAVRPSGEERRAKMQLPSLPPGAVVAEAEAAAKSSMRCVKPFHDLHRQSLDPLFP